MKQIGIPIKLVVSPEHERQAKVLIGSMAVNVDKWMAGEQPLIYKIGEHLTSKLILEIQTEIPEVPLGVSQWKEHGIKYGYDKYFKIKWPN